MSSQRTFVVVLLSFLFACPILAQQRSDRQSAWDALIQENPSVVDDAQIGWKDRLIMYALSPEQAQDYYRGADPNTIQLDNGQTLQQHLDQRMAPTGNLYFPLPIPCSLFSLEGSASAKPLTLMAHGEDLSRQGGSVTGCDVPEEATALMIQVQVESMASFPVRVKLWPKDGPEPAQAMVITQTQRSDSTMAVIPLSRSEYGKDKFQVSVSDWSRLEGQVVGYFRKPEAIEGPGAGILFSSESGSNNFFGTGAGGSITTGVSNSFFGAQTGAANTEGSNNTFMGRKSGNSNTTGSLNSFYGQNSGFDNTSGDENSFFGQAAGRDNTTGSYNAFFGRSAGYTNTNGSNNSFYGHGAGFKNTIGGNNSFFGRDAGRKNTTAWDNSFYGRDAGYNNTTGFSNSFFGYQSGYSNTEGNHNTFVGELTGRSNTTGDGNTFVGQEAGFSNSTAGRNTFVGQQAGKNNTTGQSNSFFGYQAGYLNTNGWANTFVGVSSGSKNTEGENNSFYGQGAGYNNTTGYHNTFIGSTSGFKNTTGYLSTFVGRGAGYNTTEGTRNSFFGAGAGFNNTTGSGNSFYGTNTGSNNTEGVNNSFYGRSSGRMNTTGSSNSFFGNNSGENNTTGYGNVFIGWASGYFNTTGWSNSIIGEYSGYNNTTGYRNTFHGAYSGYNSTEGTRNTAVGLKAGFFNTTGGYNSFLGANAGDSNTTEDYNSFLGAASNGAEGITNATAIGYKAQVSQSNSLVLGSIAGKNGSYSYVDVGIGTPTPSAPLHVIRDNGSAKILVEERAATTEVRTMLELKNQGGARITLKDTSLKTAWIFSTNNLDQFYFSRAGTTGAEILLAPNGRLMIGPGNSTVFDLDPSGNLLITGDLTANGVVYASDRNRKKNFNPIDPQQTLEKLVSVPITEWNFKTDDTRHIGPMAQDFYAAFGVGKDDKHINPTDTAGVTMAAIQGLYQQNLEMKFELRDKDQEIECLKARVSELESLETRLAKLEMLSRTLEFLSSSLPVGSYVPIPILPE